MTDFTKYEFYKGSHVVSEIKLFGVSSLIYTEVSWMDEIWDERRYQLHHQFINKKLADVSRIYGDESKEYEECDEITDEDGLTTYKKKKEYRLPMSNTGFRSAFTNYYLIQDPRKWDTNEWWESIKKECLYQLFGEDFKAKAKNFEKIGLIPFIPVGITINKNVETN